MGQKKRVRPRTADDSAIDLARRRTLAQLGAFATYTAPALTTLLVSGQVKANHNPLHVEDPPLVCDGPPDPPACGANPCSEPNAPPFCSGSLSAGPEAQGQAFEASWEPPPSAPDPGDDGAW